MRGNQILRTQSTHPFQRISPGKHGAVGTHWVAQHWETEIEQITRKKRPLRWQPHHQMVKRLSFSVIQLEANTPTLKAIFVCKCDVRGNVTIPGRSRKGSSPLPPG